MKLSLQGINPTPWMTSSPGGRGKKGFKPAVLAAYQAAVAADVKTLLPEDWKPVEGPIRLHFTLRREIETWATLDGKAGRSQPADATNMQKALEDALQGVLFKNDRQVRDIRTTIAAQDVGVAPLIVIEMEEM